MSKQPITSVAQLRRRKVWVPNNDRGVSITLKAFGVTPVPLSIADVLPGLQTGLLDTIAAIALQWHTQIKYVTQLPFAVAGTAFVCA